MPFTRWNEIFLGSACGDDNIAKFLDEKSASDEEKIQEFRLDPSRVDIRDQKIIYTRALRWSCFHGIHVSRL